MEKLKKYNQKRNFDKTDEPEGKAKRGRKKNLVFAVQHHLARRDHFDFRLEWNGVLLSWAVPKGPSFNPADKRLAVHVEDHPLDYADFEGVIPKGQYGGGSVLLWDIGTWTPNLDFEEGLEKGSLKFKLQGKRLKGDWALVRLKPKEGEKDDNWLLIKEKDEYAKDNDGISNFVESIKSGRTSKEIEIDEDKTLKTNPFDHAEVQLATLVEKIPKGKEWLFEIKYDGYRILTFCEKGRVVFKSRNNNDFTSKFKVLARQIEDWANGRAFVLDGEMIVSDKEGRSNFQDLQNYIKNPNDKELSYVVFDILALDGEDLRQKPLMDRKEILRDFLKNAPNLLLCSEHVVGNGQDCFDAALKLGLEGIVGKKMQSVYAGARNEDWVKMKCYKRQEFVVGGFTLSNKKNNGISSLLLGVFEGKDFVFVGKTGTGMRGFDVQALQQEFVNLKSEEPKFKNPPNKKSAEQIFWLRPKVVVEIQYVELTSEKLLRQASFKGIRKDKNAKDVVFENANKIKSKQTKIVRKRENCEVCGVKISNPDKIVFKDRNITKMQVIEYYYAVFERMLLYVKNRILSVVRCHNGVGANCFYKKHPNTISEGVRVVPVINSEGEEDDYFYVENEKGLIFEVQLGTIEFHIWGSLANTMDMPDMMVFDLDPDEGMGIDQIRQGVKDLKSILDELSLKSFLKTSGGKGYHVVVPFKKTPNWDVFHDFAKNVAIAMESKWPEKYTSNIRKDSRKGKIFIDWVRNGRGATSVAPYSLRARDGAKVSMPILWSELDKIAPNEIDMFDAVKRLKKKDPWTGFFDVVQELKA